VILLLFEILEGTEVSIIQIAVSEVWCLLTNCELYTPSFGGTFCIACFFGVLCVCETLHSVGIICITHRVFLQELNVEIVIRTFLCCLDSIAMLGDVKVLVEQISVSTLAYRLIWISVSLSCVHLPSS
jgi:hypothetical protein